MFLWWSLLWGCRCYILNQWVQQIFYRHEINNAWYLIACINNIIRSDCITIGPEDPLCFVIDNIMTLYTTYVAFHCILIIIYHVLALQTLVPDPIVDIMTLHLQIHESDSSWSIIDELTHQNTKFTVIGTKSLSEASSSSSMLMSNNLPRDAKGYIKCSDCVCSCGSSHREGVCNQCKQLSNMTPQHQECAVGENN